MHLRRRECNALAARVSLCSDVVSYELPLCQRALAAHQAAIWDSLLAILALAFALGHRDARIPGSDDHDDKLFFLSSVL